MHLLSTRLSAGLWMCSSLSTFLQSCCSELNKPSKYSLSRENFKAERKGRVKAVEKRVKMNISQIIDTYILLNSLNIPCYS